MSLSASLHFFNFGIADRIDSYRNAYRPNHLAHFHRDSQTPIQESHSAHSSHSTPSVSSRSYDKTPTNLATGDVRQPRHSFASRTSPSPMILSQPHQQHHGGPYRHGHSRGNREPHHYHQPSLSSTLATASSSSVKVRFYVSHKEHTCSTKRFAQFVSQMNCTVPHSLSITTWVISTREAGATISLPHRYHFRQTQQLFWALLLRCGALSQNIPIQIVSAQLSSLMYLAWFFMIALTLQWQSNALPCQLGHWPITPKPVRLLDTSVENMYHAHVLSQILIYSVFFHVMHEIPEFCICFDTILTTKCRCIFFEVFT